jgi:hypothetical protein
METVRINLAADTWTRLDNGDHFVMFSIDQAQAVAVHFSADPDTAPASDAPFHSIRSFTPDVDFQITGLTGAQHVWVRAIGRACSIVVSR